MNPVISDIAKYFGVDNNTVFTVIATLFVFGMGLLIQQFNKLINSRIQKRTIKKQFKNILIDLIPNINKQSISFLQLANDLNINHEGSISLTWNPIPQIAILEKFDWASLSGYYLDRKLFHGKLRNKAFRKLQNNIELVKNIQSTYSSEFHRFVKDIIKYEEDFKSSIDNTRRIYEEMILLNNSGQITSEQQEYLKKIRTVIESWQQIENNKSKIVLHDYWLKNIIKISTDFKNNVQAAYIVYDHLLMADYAYTNIDTTMNILSDLFKKYGTNYYQAARIISKSINILSNNDCDFRRCIRNFLIFKFSK